MIRLTGDPFVPLTPMAQSSVWSLDSQASEIATTWMSRHLQPS